MNPIDCNEILVELMMNPLPRLLQGKNQTFGIVSRRSNQADYSRNNWTRPYLYHLLLDFGDKYCPIKYNTITLMKQSNEKKNRYSVGLSWMIGLGDYTGGEFMVDSVEKTIKGQGGTFNLNRSVYKLNEVLGNGIVICYSTYDPRKIQHLPEWRLRNEGIYWSFYRGSVRMGKVMQAQETPARMKIIRGETLITWD